MERVLKRFGIQTATGTDRAGKTRTSGQMEPPRVSLSLSLFYVEVEKYGAVVMLMRLYRQTFFFISVSSQNETFHAFFPRLPLAEGKFANGEILTKTSRVSKIIPFNLTFALWRMKELLFY